LSDLGSGLLLLLALLQAPLQALVVVFVALDAAVNVLLLLGQLLAQC